MVDADPKLAKTAITQLSGLLRSSLHTSTKKTISLREELQTVTDYLAIESIRFDERMHWEFNITGDTYDCQVPPMMLQTLVENAVKHGLSTRKNGGAILLNSFKENNQLIIQLINTGQYTPNEKRQGVGLENTRQRLHILYDEHASLQIKNKDHEHVETLITIPL